jgi:hypothetical protein
LRRARVFAEQHRRFLAAEEFREKGELLLATGKTTLQVPRRTTHILENPVRIGVKFAETEPFDLG